MSKDISSVLIDTGRTEARAFETGEMRRYHVVMAKVGRVWSGKWNHPYNHGPSMSLWAWI